jgi:hypothetical protein
MFEIGPPWVGLHIYSGQGLWARGRCPIVLIFNTDNNRESVEQIFSKVPVKEMVGLHIYSGQLICTRLHLHLLRKLHVKYNDHSLSSSWESCFSIAACAIVEPHTDPEVYIGVILNILIKIILALSLLILTCMKII